ncbi:MAG: DNA mismatch repair endonuclease MutL [Candidatus Cloacimonetes bacterium]|jgi:DNA mismatch repair protein MutL|nr:DNA mismatch repair endonuclease MutL [Candidatus Cloacimonadota bacterium]MCK9332158.1 DNA mismatch repair endonuclease MutL [Candidatus Cloacimonadota bacterium]MDD4231275.1 DNA mismatch repair endonuclease MutL [Candidatus Cloacimonadota bacterium]MDY0299816.1 DNA mismatch repair endonuclease MutL [Candidatus Cloacimonadaceae bacterium]
MPKINILSENVRNKIAAGEVIERPASVVKELVENSIDSGADSITVIVENGGKDMIQVIDNGEGMEPDDAMLALESHATSKIRNVDDIVHINSLGFRGEALPSIASVSKFTLLTRSRNLDVALRIEMNDGKLLDVMKTSSNPGTSIWVRGLFKSLPARRKFLRSETVELRHILKYFHYQAIIYPNISFKLIADSKEKLNYIGGNDRNKRMSEIFGSSFFNDDIIEIDAAAETYAVSGYIFGLEERSDKLIDAQYVFINGRFINDKTVKHSIKSAYAPFILKTRAWMKGNTPPYILFITVPPEQIDINVSPTKNEVRFREQQKVHSLIFQTISKALQRYEENKFATARSKFSAIPQMTERASSLERDIFVQNVPIPRYSEYKKEHSQMFQDDLFEHEPTKKPANIPIVNPEKVRSQEQQEIFNDQPNDTVPYKLLLQNEEDYINPWQLHNTYIFVQIEDGLVIIDQHAAHERILYEKLIQRTGGAPAVRQKLIIPLVIDIPPYIANEIRDLIDSNIHLLEKIGFSLKKFSGDSIVIEEIPAELGDFQGGKIFIDILKQLETELEINADFRDSLAKSIACKAAIKANTKLSRREMLSLVNNLFACRVPYFCPHGRPLIVKMTLTDFEKKFKRLV